MSDEDEDTRRPDDNLGALWVRIPIHTDGDGDVVINYDSATVLVRDGMMLDDLEYIENEGFYGSSDLDGVLSDWASGERSRLADGTSTVPFKE